MWEELKYKSTLYIILTILYTKICTFISFTGYLFHLLVWLGTNEGAFTVVLNCVNPLKWLSKVYDFIDKLHLHKQVYIRFVLVK